MAAVFFQRKTNGTAKPVSESLLVLFITRTRVAQDLHIFVSCHPRSRSLPHLTLTTSTSSLSLTSPTFPTFSPSHPSPLVHYPYLPCDVPWQSGRSTQIPSLTSYERKSVENKAFDTEAIEPTSSSPEELSLTGILGHIRVKDKKDLRETLLLKIWTYLEKFVQRYPASSHRCIPIMTQRRALQTRILKMENNEKCWLHHCLCTVEKTVNPLECQSHRRNLLHCYRRLEQVQHVFKLL